MSFQFISSAIEPVPGTIDPARMSAGEPGLPREFRWGERMIRIAEVLRTWRETGDCRHGSGERYVRRHWFEAATDAGEIAKICFERQSRSRQVKKRWRLYTLGSRDPD